MKPISTIKSYHAHIYYDADSIDRARAVIDAFGGAEVCAGAFFEHTAGLKMFEGCRRDRNRGHGRRRRIFEAEAGVVGHRMGV